MSAAQPYPAPVRWLHSALAVCTLAQLAVGELMTVPGIAEAEEEASLWLGLAWAHEAHDGVPAPETLGFEVHEFLGMTVAALVFIRLAMAFAGMPNAGWRELFPWLFADGRRALLAEVRAQWPGWLKGRLAAPEEGEMVARSVHGLILLAVALMGASGAVLFTGWNAHGHQTELIEAVGEMHELVAGVLEALLAAHVLAVILHIRNGHRILDRIKPHG